MRFALLVSSRAMCPPKDVIGKIGIRCENTKQFTSFTSSKQRRRPKAKKDTIIIDFGGGGKKKSGGQNVVDDVKVDSERGGGGETHDGVTQKGSRRSTFIAVASYASCAFFAQGGGFLPNNANAYGSGGWGDCAPVCDALKDGFSAQQKMQEEMLRLSLATMNNKSDDDDESGGGDDGSEKEGAKKKSDKVDFAQKSSEREKRKKNSTTRRQ